MSARRSDEAARRAGNSAYRRGAYGDAVRSYTVGLRAAARRNSGSGGGGGGGGNGRRRPRGGAAAQLYGNRSASWLALATQAAAAAAEAAAAAALLRECNASSEGSDQGDAGGDGRYEPSGSEGGRPRQRRRRWSGAAGSSRRPTRGDHDRDGGGGACSRTAAAAGAAVPADVFAFSRISTINSGLTSVPDGDGGDASASSAGCSTLLASPRGVACTVGCSCCAACPSLPAAYTRRAVRDARRATDAAPDDATAWHRLADALVVAGDTRGAWRALRSGLTHCPDHKALVAALARVEGLQAAAHADGAPADDGGGFDKDAAEPPSSNSRAPRPLCSASPPHSPTAPPVPLDALSLIAPPTGGGSDNDAVRRWSARLDAAGAAGSPPDGWAHTARAYALLRQALAANTAAVAAARRGGGDSSRRARRSLARSAALLRFGGGDVRAAEVADKYGGDGGLAVAAEAAASGPVVSVPRWGLPFSPTPPPHELPPAAATGGPASMLSLPSSMSAEQPMSIPELLPSRELLSASIHGKGERWAPSRAPRGGGAAGRRPLPAPPPWQRQWLRPPAVGGSSTCSAARRGGRARPAARWRRRR